MTMPTLDLAEPPMPPRPRREPRAATPIQTAVDVVLAEPPAPAVQTQFPELRQYIGNPADRLAPEDQQRFVLAVGKLCRRGWQPDQFWREFTREEQARGRSRVAVSLRYGVGLPLLPVEPEDTEARSRLAQAKAELTAAEAEIIEAQEHARRVHALETEVETLRARVADARALASRLQTWLEEAKGAIELYAWPSGRVDQPANILALYSNKLATEAAIADSPAQVARLEAALAAKESELSALTAATN